MIGSGIFLLPAAMAAYGGIGMIGWLCAAAGAIALAMLYGILSRYAPHSTGGPYVYARLGFGDFPGYLVAWGYWIAIWATNAAIAVALVGYLSVFVPALNESALLSIITGLGFIWGFTWINSKPIQWVAKIQIFTTILKVIPILAIGLFGIFYINWDYFMPFNLSDESTLSAITSTTTLALFAFLGMESAGIISAETKEAAKTVKKATIGGTGITIIVYILSSFAIMGIIPPDTLINSKAPFADAAFAFWGDAAKFIVAGSAVIATMGALNGWILLQGRIPMAAAMDGLFPKVFERRNQHNAPVIGIIISSILASLLMISNFSKSLVDAFTFMMTLSTLSCLVPYLFSAGSLALFVFKNPSNRKAPLLLLSLIAFSFCIWVIIGCGYEVVFYGFLLLMLSIPFYVYLKRKEN